MQGLWSWQKMTLQRSRRQETCADDSLQLRLYFCLHWADLMAKVSLSCFDAVLFDNFFSRHMLVRVKITFCYNSIKLGCMCLLLWTCPTRGWIAWHTKIEFVCIFRNFSRTLCFCLWCVQIQVHVHLNAARLRSILVWSVWLTKHWSFGQTSRSKRFWHDYEQKGNVGSWCDWASSPLVVPLLSVLFCVCF